MSLIYSSIKDLQAKLDQTNKEIDNIINAIMAGITSETLKTKMNELEVIKVNLEAEIVKVSCNEKKEVVTKITEEQVRAMIFEMKGYVINRDLPQCKQLIRDFVKEVIVYRNHVEVIFSMVFSCNTNKVCYVKTSKGDSVKGKEIIQGIVVKNTF